MPVIYGNSKAGIAHRELQPIAEPKPAIERRRKPLPVEFPDWMAVRAGGTLYATAHAADVAHGWIAGSCERALKKGLRVYRGVAISRANDSA